MFQNDVAMETIVIDRENERVICLREVPKHVPSRMPGKTLSQATVWRWALRPNNPLETFCTPGGRFTSLERIADQCTRFWKTGLGLCLIFQAFLRLTGV